MARQTKQQIKESKLQRDRLRILLDVVSQLDAKIYSAEQGVYVKFDDKVKTKEIAKNGDLQERLTKLVTKKKPCRVCALGACFLSSVRLFDKVKAQEVVEGLIRLAPDAESREDIRHDVDHKSMREKLGTFFTELEMGVIEALFEDKVSFIGGESRDWVESEAQAQRDELENDSGLLRSVLDACQDEWRGIESRLRWIMNAAANLVHIGHAINVRGFRDQALVSLGSDSRFEGVRDEYGL